MIVPAVGIERDGPPQRRVGSEHIGAQQQRLGPGRCQPIGRLGQRRARIEPCQHLACHRDGARPVACEKRERRHIDQQIGLRPQRIGGSISRRRLTKQQHPLVARSQQRAVLEQPPLDGKRYRVGCNRVIPPLPEQAPGLLQRASAGLGDDQGDGGGHGLVVRTAAGIRDVWIDGNREPHIVLVGCSAELNVEVQAVKFDLFRFLPRHISVTSSHETQRLAEFTVLITTYRYRSKIYCTDGVCIFPFGCNGKIVIRKMKMLVD